MKKKKKQCSLSIVRSIVMFSYETTIHERKDVTGGRRYLLKIARIRRQASVTSIYGDSNELDACARY